MQYNSLEELIAYWEGRKKQLEERSGTMSYAYDYMVELIEQLKYLQGTSNTPVDVIKDADPNVSSVGNSLIDSITTELSTNDKESCLYERKHPGCNYDAYSFPRPMMDVSFGMMMKKFAGKKVEISIKEIK